MELDRELILKKINLLSIEENKTEMIKILCEIIDNKKFFKENIDLAIYIMRICELYGYAMYFESHCDLDDFNFNLSELIRHDMYKSKMDSKKYYNAGQLSLLNEIELNNKMFISAPTSFGKTSLIMEYVYMNYLKLNNIIFIVPTNSLVEELYIKFLKINKKCNNKYNITTTPKKKGNNNIWILTPEKFLLLFEDFDKTIDLFVMDESYKIEDEEQSNIFDVLNTRSSKYRRVMEMITKKDVKSIFLSPYTYLKDKSMERFLNKYDIKVIDRNLNYVQKNIFDISNGKKFCQTFNTSGIIYKKDISGIKKALNTLPFLNDNTIIYVRYPSEAIDIINDISFNFQCDDNSQERYSEFIKHLEDKYLFDDSNWYIIDALKRGIGIYVSPIPRYIKREIVNLFNYGVLKILIVTTAFSEGVNSSAKNIIITSRVAGSNKKLTTLDLLNLSGRAGRFGIYSIGNIYVANDDTYDILKESSEVGVTIKNSNYKIFEYNENRTDYDLDIIDDEIMNEKERKRKNDILQKQEYFGLTDLDLNVALSISKSDKLKLYKFFVEEKLDYETVYLNIKNLMSEDRKNVVDSIKFIFNHLKLAEIRITCDFGDIPAYNYNNDFIWGDFYAIHSSGDIKNILKNRKKYINQKISNIKYDLKELKNEQLKTILKIYNCSWISDYLTNGIIDDTKLYNGAFKFIANIIEYRIPFYIGFYVSIFKLFCRKKGLDFNFDFEMVDISTSLENKKIDDKNEKMIDYGFPIDLVKKVSKDESQLDNYEKTILKEYRDLFDN